MLNNIGEYLLSKLTDIGLWLLFGGSGDFNRCFLEPTVQSAVNLVECCNDFNVSLAADGCARIPQMSAFMTAYGIRVTAVFHWISLAAAAPSAVGYLVTSIYMAWLESATKPV